MNEEAAEAEAERTAFLSAEKRYKLYKSQPPQSGRMKQSYKKVDLSDVFDFRAILEHFERSERFLIGFLDSSARGSIFLPSVSMIGQLPGFYFDPEKNRYFSIKGPIPGLKRPSSSSNSGDSSDKIKKQHATNARRRNKMKALELLQLGSFLVPHFIESMQIHLQA